MHVLITAFDPFKGESTNASELIVEALKERIEIHTQVLPTSFHRSYPLLQQAVSSYKPDLVILLGLMFH